MVYSFGVWLELAVSMEWLTLGLAIPLTLVNNCGEILMTGLQICE